jgi:hypothetical protein
VIVVSRRGFDRRDLLAGIAVGVPVLEASLLFALGLTGGLGLAAQATAIGPFGIFHDLRWLFVFHDSVLGFTLGAAVAVSGRALLSAVVVRAAWPEGTPLPRFRTLALHGLAATLAAAVLLSPWVTLLFGAALLPVSWVFFAAVPATLLTILLIHHGGVDTSWWRRLPPLRSMGWIALSFLVLSAVSALVAGRSPVAAIPLVALGGVFNAWAWRRTVRCIVVRTPARRMAKVPLTSGAVVVLLAVVVGGSWAGFAAAAGAPKRPAAAIPDEGSRAVLVVPGFASDCCDEGLDLAAEAPGLLVEQFSYTGIDRDERPVPHDGTATDADLGTLAERMAVQVDSLSRRTGGDVVLIAESEGSLIAAVYLDSHPAAPVDRLVLLSPIVEPVRVTFPDEGVEGRGMVAGLQLRAMTDLIDTLAPFTITVDGPLGDSVRRSAADLHDGTLCDRPGVEEIAFIPVADAVTNPPAAHYAIPVVHVPGFHGGLRGRADVRALILAWLDGDDLEDSAAWAFVARVVADSASAWQVPPLGPYFDASGSGALESCPTV